jgi:putative endonuclease
MKRGGAVYIMTNKVHTVLYTGITSDLKKRIYRHGVKWYPVSFAARYNLYKLVYFEGFQRIEDAIAREKQIKGKSRKKKNDLINAFNPGWINLYDEVMNW